MALPMTLARPESSQPAAIPRAAWSEVVASSRGSRITIARVAMGAQ